MRTPDKWHPQGKRFFRPIADRLWEKVDKSGEHWLWTRSSDGHGYGRLTVTGDDGRRTTEKAHRISWRLVHGEIPTGMEVCHKCDIPACVRPDHLFLGTHRDNMRDMAAKGRWGNVPTPGAAHWAAKLTDEQVAEVRAFYAAKKASGKWRNSGAKELAARLGVTYAHMWAIGNGRAWRGDNPRVRRRANG